MRLARAGSTDQTMDAKLERICDGLVALAASGRRLEERCDAYERSLRSYG